MPSIQLSFTQSIPPRKVQLPHLHADCWGLGTSLFGALGLPSLSQL